MAIRLSENFIYDVVAHFFVHEVVALNSYELGGLLGLGVLLEQK